MTHTWKKSRVKTKRQLANFHGFVMYTNGTAVAREQMLSAKIRLWKGPACQQCHLAQAKKIAASMC